MSPRTLLELAGVTSLPARLSETVLVVIDAQQEYVDGALPLAGVDPALAEIGRLLERARKATTPVIHVVHHGKSTSGPFAPGSRGVEIASPAAPAPGEPVIAKSLPNAFASTDLADRLHALHRSSLVLVGFMTHMCIEATARGAIDLGLKATVVAGATATRDLRDPLSGAVIPAAEVHRNALAALSDRFATIVSSCDRLDD
ncbi:cysteine hydrolase family protein [Rhodoplanes roseus]|uniref:Cysteine hydrolase n=1 Tax=Rhodoplanes roseus TaxID=29409 RepID=A0A327KTZ8_9BRAD|nr:cysteine hydrolase family protein [Rhodoplanes roseus]RAI40905.1 cysteine hydrolase [Rhodoplanes roseus]